MQGIKVTNGIIDEFAALGQQIKDHIFKDVVPTKRPPHLQAMHDESVKQNTRNFVQRRMMHGYMGQRQNKRQRGWK